ncbi:MAG TPA: class I adenylate-forming enzyme family protein [Syntrophales bacterium]|nr:class I adenylate-forming enzyme family protein [Syntrophales bacterium]
MQLIHHFLERSADLYPEKTALIHENTRASYTQINSQANILARHLLDRGVTHGDRVVLLMENCPEYVTGYYGILKAGAVAVPLNTGLKPDCLQDLLQDIEPTILISSSRFERVLGNIDLNDSTIRELILKDPHSEWSSTITTTPWENLISSDSSPNPVIPISDSNLANIIFTSGSTGKLKGVMLSHLNMVANTQSICQYLNLTADDIQMVVLPFFYVMGKSLLNTHFAVGGTVVINNKFAFTASVLNQMVEERVTGFSGVPSTYAFLLNRSPLTKYRDRLDSLRYCSQAGGHMSRTTKMELRESLPTHTQIYIMYGATEASARLSYLDPDKFTDKIDSIGKAIPGVNLRVLDKSGEAVEAGEIGELVASGPNIMQGYWRDHEATAKVLDNGTYHTGDMAYQDDEGFFYLVGRNDDMIKTGGHRVNPLEIEDTLMDSGLLMEAVVLGVPDKLLGRRLAALVTPKNLECDEKEILRYCALKLPKHKVPGTIKLTRNIPKSETGKIDRARCRLEMK